jgi:hypothetical protein
MIASVIVPSEYLLPSQVARSLAFFLFGYQTRSRSEKRSLVVILGE